jgi:hypothetical protein
MVGEHDISSENKVKGNQQDDPMQNQTKVGQY